MFPNKEIAEDELKIVVQSNQGPWTEHSKRVLQLKTCNGYPKVDNCVVLDKCNLAR